MAESQFASYEQFKFNRHIQVFRMLQAKWFAFGVVIRPIPELAAYANCRKKKAIKLRYLREFNDVISQTNGTPVRFPRDWLYLHYVPTRLWAYSTACFLF